jgi:hypothetical protein
MQNSDLEFKKQQLFNTNFHKLMVRWFHVDHQRGRHVDTVNLAGKYEIDDE